MHGNARRAIAKGRERLLVLVAAALVAGVISLVAVPAATAARPLAHAAGKADQLGLRTLKMGMTGPDVKLLQSWLTDLRFSVPRTGLFGPATAAQVRAFQRHQRLDADGVVGPATAAALTAAHGGSDAGDDSGGDGGGHSDGGHDGGGHDGKDGNDGGSDQSDQGQGDGSSGASSGEAGWTFPFRPGVASPPSTWTPDQGQDIFPRSGQCGPRAELLAVADATVVEIGLSGFGAQAPVIKLDSGPYAGRYVYYGHAQPALVQVGDHVKAGEPIAQVGCGQVGISSGPHLELGMSVPGGPPCCPGFGVTAPLVRQILVSIYH